MKAEDHTMKMRQREILNAVSPDFQRDNMTKAEYIAKKIDEIKSMTLEYMEKNRMDGYILGLSGGIDSFVCAALIADAIKDTGKELHLLLMPNGTQSDMADSIACVDALKARFSCVSAETISIENAYSGALEDIGRSQLFDVTDKYALGNLQARLRMIIQYSLGKRLLVAGTEHATENVTAYFTKFGDGGCDFIPTDGLLKNDIYEIAKIYEAPEAIIKKAPAAGLGISKSDEDELGVTYDDLCQYLSGHLIEKSKADRIFKLYEASEHKRHLPASPRNLWWKEKSQLTTHIVVDALHDFIRGSLPCLNAEESIDAAIDYINEHPEMQVFYVRDHHPETHCSFKENGGIWPAHCVIGETGSEIDERYYTNIKKTVNSPIAHFNIFNKGENPMQEEYSGFGAKNEFFGQLRFNLSRKVVVSGMATEYCIKETVLLLLKNGFDVSILKRGLAYIDKEEHEKVLAELESIGAKII